MSAGSGPLPSPRTCVAAVVVLLAALALRSAFFLRFDESYFDADQAIVGLMAKHLAEGRTVPLFFYGQRYLLAVEAWVMAPVFVVLGPTVFALRLTMVLLNVALLAAAWWTLVRDARLGPWWAVLVLLPLACAPFITAAHLVEAQGGNVEMLVWVVVAWWLRRRPLALGVGMAIAFLQREFTAYALVALAALDLAEH